MMEYIEEERFVVATERENLLKAKSDEEKQVLKLQTELDHARERVRYITIGFVRLSEILSYGQTPNDKVSLGYKGKENEKVTTQLTFVKTTVGSERLQC